MPCAQKGVAANAEPDVNIGAKYLDLARRPTHTTAVFILLCELYKLKTKCCQIKTDKHSWFLFYAHELKTQAYLIHTHIMRL